MQGSTFVVIKKRIQGHGRRSCQEYNKFHHNGNQGGNQGWGQQGGNNNGWGNEGSNNNGWGQQQGGGNNNSGWGNQGANNNNGWGNEGNNNGWGNEGNNNGWGQQGGNQNNGGNNSNNGWLNTDSLWGNSFQHVAQIQGGFNMQNIAQFVEQQIVLIEPSPHQAVLEQLKKNGQTFNDDRFPPNERSLSGQWGPQSQWKSITWQPISKVLSNSNIFQSKVQPNDISQGYLGDCYFLAALAAIAEIPHRISNLFITKECNDQKYFSVKLLFKGKWMTIDMDEYIPIMGGKPAFTKAKQGQLWVVLLEKAWAKLYTSYKRIEAGYPQQGLHDLTGAPVKQISLQGANFNKQKEWNYLLDASQRQYAMVSSSQPGSDTQKSVTGVVQGHAYTFLQACSVSFQGQQVRLVQLRNPWGKGQSKTNWCDADPKWNQVSPADKQRIGFNDNVDDGTFFMSWDDYCKQFRALTVCEIDDNASYIYKSKKDPQRKGCYFRVDILKDGNYCFNVDKTPERSFEDKLQNSYNYPTAQISVGQLNGNSVTGKQGLSSAKRTLYFDIDLRAGTYIVFVKIHFDGTFEKEFDVNLAVYAQYPCKIELASRNQAVAFTGSQNVDWTGEPDKAVGEWNKLASYGGGQNNNGGWGQEQNNNGGWGQQQNTGGWGSSSSNNEWGNQGGNQGGSNDGWGNSNTTSNNEWGNTNQQQNSGWGNSNQQQNSGWGNSGNNGW